jgi:glutamate-1-semialdehyde 2,1-aminomutase
MEEVNGWRQIDARGDVFVSDLTDKLATAAPHLKVVRHGSIFWIRPRHDTPVRRPDQIPGGHADWYRHFFHAALVDGVYLPPSPYEVCFLSLAHDTDILAKAAVALADAAAHPAHG